MMNSTKSLALAAAVAGLLGGTAVRVNAQPTSNAPTTVQAAGVARADDPRPHQALLQGKERL
jgi:hypothetical protein